MQIPTLLHSLGALLIALSVLAAVQLALLAHSLARFDQDGTFSRGNPGFSRGADFITPLVFAAYTLLLPSFEYAMLLRSKKHNRPLYKQWSVSLTLGFTLAYAIISLWRVQNLPERVGGFLCGRVLGDGSCAELKAIIAFNALVLVAAIISIGLWSHLHRQDRALWHSGGLQPQFAMPQTHHGHPGDVENAHWHQHQHGGYQPGVSAPPPPAYYTQPGAPQAGKQGR